MVSVQMQMDNSVFSCYLTYVSILVLKMMLMSVLTSIQRKKHNVPATPEDSGLYSSGKNAKTAKSHDDVDRVKRAHLNDLENILLFIPISYIYCLTNPSAFVATMLIRIYTASRCIHTYVYAIHVIGQPVRGIAWAIGYFITGYMAVTSILHFAQF